MFFRIVVDYSKSLNEMLLLGNYKRVSFSTFSRRLFWVEGQGKVETSVKFVHYDELISWENIIRDLNSRGLRHVTLLEALAFDAKYREKQKEFSIAVLGSAWKLRDWCGDRMMPFFCTINSQRWIDVLYWPSGKSITGSFLVARK